MNLGLDLSGSRIATYSRFSTDSQRDASIADQERVAFDFIARCRGDVAQIRRLDDRAVSASSLQREGFERLMKLARAREIDVIVTENTDRISRDFADSAIVFRELRFLGVRLIGVSNSFDSFSSHAQIQMALEGWKNEQYLADLRFKTRRGQEGRVRNGLSAGGLPMGYRTEPVLDSDGKEIGRAIVIDEQRAAVVRRVFTLYLDGLSIDRIAKLFNQEGVPPARRGKYKDKGWVGGTVRQMLRNEAYVGRWTWGARKWVKLPGTNTRRYRKAAEDQVVRREYPERRIIDQATWDATQARIKAVYQHYARTSDGKPKGMAHPGKKTTYPLSSVLHCAECGSRMIIYGGSGPFYYRCSQNKKKGTCSNSISLREDEARKKILAGIIGHFSSPEAIDELQRSVRRWLDELTQKKDDRISELRAQLASVNARIQRVVREIEEGCGSRALSERLAALEVEQGELERQIKESLAGATAPVRIPSVESIMASALDLQQAFEHDPSAARDALSRIFEGGRLMLHPKAPRGYVARSRIFLGGFGGPDGRGGRVRRSASSIPVITPAQPPAGTRPATTEGSGRPGPSAFLPPRAPGRA